MAKKQALPAHLADAVKRETQGTAVHWVGQSDPRTAFWKTTLIWLFAVPWTVFAVGWELAVLGALFSSASNSMSPALHTGFAIVFPLWGLPFIAVGLAMLSAPFWVARACRNTAHVITANELMNVGVNGRGTVTVKRTRIREVCGTERTEKANGFGTLKITTGWHKDSDGDKVENAETWVGIPDVRQVEAILLQARSAPG